MKKIKYDQIHPAIRQAIGCHEGFRKLGFVSDDLFVHFNPDNSMLVVLKTQGKDFSVTVGWVEGVSHDEWQELWASAAEAVRDQRVTQKDMDRIWQESLPFNNAHGFLMAIMSKGIRVPNAVNHLH